MNRKTIKQTKCLHDYVQHYTPRKTRPFTLEMAWNIGVGLTVLLALIYVAAQMVRGMHMLNGLTP